MTKVFSSTSIPALTFPAFAIIAFMIACSSSVAAFESARAIYSSETEQSSQQEELEYECLNCHRPVTEEATKCPHCGTVFLYTTYEDGSGRDSLSGAGIGIIVGLLCFGFFVVTTVVVVIIVVVVANTKKKKPPAGPTYTR